MHAPVLRVLALRYSWIAWPPSTSTMRRSCRCVSERAVLCWVPWHALAPGTASCRLTNVVYHCSMHVRTKFLICSKLYREISFVVSSAALVLSKPSFLPLQHNPHRRHGKRNGFHLQPVFHTGPNYSANSHDPHNRARHNNFREIRAGRTTIVPQAQGYCAAVDESGQPYQCRIEETGMCCYPVHPSQQSHVADCVLQHQEKADLVEQIAHCDRQVLGAQADQARLQYVPCGALRSTPL